MTLAPPPDRRVVLLSPGGAFPRDVLAALGSRGSRVSAHLVYRGVHGRAASPPPSPLRSAARALRNRLDRALRAAAGETVFTGPLNGERMARDLVRLRPDVVVLARCALLDPRLLEIPPGGTLNVHPALLPWIRGNSPLGNSLLRGVALGCTAFRVDPGIDTGPIVERRLMPVRGGESREELRDALYRLWLEMTVDLVERVRDCVPSGVPPAERFSLCRTLSDDDERRVADAVARGEHLALFRRWASVCEGLRLPLDVSAPPGAGLAG